MTREHKFLSGNQGNLCVKEFQQDGMPPVQEKKRMDTRENRGERLQEIAEGVSSAPCLASSSTMSFLGKNECLGIHCSLIVLEEREDIFF